MSVLTSRKSEYEDLAKRLKKGEEPARHAFVELFAPRARQFFERRGLAGAYAEDLAVTSVGEIILKIDKYRPREIGGFEAWCFAFARNLLKRWWRERKRKRASALPEGIAAPAGLVDGPAGLRLDAAVRKALKALADTDRNVLILRARYKEDGYAWVAGQLGITTEAARVRYHRAKERFRLRLESLLGRQEWLRKPPGRRTQTRGGPRKCGSEDERPRQAVC